MQTTRDLVVGLFVLAGLATIAYLSIQVGGVSYKGSGGLTLYAAFDEVGGLKPRAPVAIAGVTVSWLIYGWFEGRDPTARQALAFTARRMGAILGAFVVIHLLQLVGFVLLVLPGLAAIVLSALTSPVLAVENLGPVASMRRSWALVRLRPGPVIGISKMSP